MKLYLFIINNIYVKFIVNALKFQLTWKSTLWM